MDWLRKIVSGKRNRFNEGGYNLDITYITPRVLAMSFPASGVEQMYRNSISDVRAVSSMSRLSTSCERSMARTSLYSTWAGGPTIRAGSRRPDWESYLFLGKIITRLRCMCCSKHVRKCTSISLVISWWIYLIGDVKNVAVIHCNAGKGRTGTLISCYLMYSGLSDNAVDAMKYYGWKRFSHGRGVT